MNGTIIFRTVSCITILVSLACIPAIPELGGVFAAFALVAECVRLFWAFVGPRC